MKDMPFAVVEGQPGNYKLTATGVIRGPVGNAGEHLVCFANSGYRYNRVVSPAYMGQMLIFDSPGELQVFLQTEVFKNAPGAALPGAPGLQAEEASENVVTDVPDDAQSEQLDLLTESP